MNPGVRTYRQRGGQNEGQRLQVPWTESIHDTRQLQVKREQAGPGQGGWTACPHRYTGTTVHRAAGRACASAHA